MQMQASAWICTYQMQTTKFMSLLPLLVCSSCPRILILLNIAPSWSMSCPCLHSHLPYIFVQTFLYLCPNFSPFVINDHKRPNTIWNLCHVKINGYHLKILLWKYLVAWCKKLDLGRWLSLESSFLMDTTNWLELTPLVTTTCGSMNTTLRCHM